MSKKSDKPAESEESERDSRLTPERIEELLKRGAKNAAELNKQLRRVFRMPDRTLYPVSYTHLTLPTILLV